MMIIGFAGDITINKVSFYCLFLLAMSTRTNVFMFGCSSATIESYQILSNLRVAIPHYNSPAQ